MSGPGVISRRRSQDCRGPQPVRFLLHPITLMGSISPFASPVTIASRGGKHEPVYQTHFVVWPPHTGKLNTDTQCLTCAQSATFRLFCNCRCFLCSFNAVEALMFATWTGWTCRGGCMQKSSWSI